MEHGDPGAAARRKAEELASAAERLERKAANARKMSNDFATGAEGEEQVARALAPLAAEGWFVLHDRVNPAGGNIDHIVVGPGAVIVLDAKAWKGELSVRDDRLYNGGWSQAKALSALSAQRDAVAAHVHEDGPVDRALVMTAQPGFEPQVVDGAVVLGVDHLLDAVRASRTSFSAEQVDAITARLLREFPAAGTAPPAASGLQAIDGVEVGDLFNRANRFLYLNQWRRYGRHRIYLRDEDGEQYGYKDVADSALHLDHDGDAMVRAVLAAATPKGLELAKDDVPKLAVPIPGGRLLGWFGRFYCSAIVGSLWERNGRRHLYGTLVNPTEGIFDLGHVDLVTGWVKPASEGPLSRDRGPAADYLAMLRDRHPFDAQP